jgi:ankyrin repeat protein
MLFLLGASIQLVGSTMGCKQSRGANAELFGGSAPAKQMTFKVDTTEGSIFDKPGNKQQSELLTFLQNDTNSDTSKLMVLLQSSSMEQKHALGEKEETALHSACEHACLECVKVLLKDGAFKIDAINRSGDTPLHVAAKRNSLEIVNLLLESGANKTQKNLWGKLPYDLAMQEAVRQALFDVHGTLILE